MGVRLVPLTGGVPIDLRRTINVIGRADDCDVSLKDSTRVSRHHCCIAYVDDRVVVRDLGSTNGVRINGRPILQATDLHAGDVVSIADLQFRVEPSSPAGRKPAHAAARPNGANHRRQQGRGAANGHKPSQIARRTSKASGNGELARRVVRFTFDIDLSPKQKAPSDGTRASGNSPATAERGDALAAAAAGTREDEFPLSSMALCSPTEEVPIVPSLITPLDSDDTLLPRNEPGDVGSDEDCLAVP